MKFPTDRISCTFAVTFFQSGPLIPEELEQQQPSGSIQELPVKFEAFPGWNPSDYFSRILWRLHAPHQVYTTSATHTPSKYWVASHYEQPHWRFRNLFKSLLSSSTSPTQVWCRWEADGRWKITFFLLLPLLARSISFITELFSSFKSVPKFCSVQGLIFNWCNPSQQCRCWRCAEKSIDVRSDIISLQIQNWFKKKETHSLVIFVPMYLTSLAGGPSLVSVVMILLFWQPSHGLKGWPCILETELSVDAIHLGASCSTV